MIHRGSIDLGGWEDASGLCKDVGTDLKTPSIFPTESLSNMFRFMLSSFPGKNGLCGVVRRTLWNAIVNAWVKTTDKQNIDKGTAWCAFTKWLLKDYLEENGACGWVAKQTTLLDV